MTAETETVRCNICRKQQPEADCFYFPKGPDWVCRGCLKVFAKRWGLMYWSPKLRKCPGCRRPVMTALFTDAWNNTARIILAHGHCRRQFTIYRRGV